MIDRDRFEPPALKRGALDFLHEVFTRTCSSCGASFTTRSRLKTLCNPCQREKTRRKHKIYDAKRRSS